jgi:hypothetical protein
MRGDCHRPKIAQPHGWATRYASAAHRTSWMDCALAGVRGRTSPTDLSPGVQILDRINDPSAKLAVHRTGAVAAMLLQRSCRKPQTQSRVGGFEISRARICVHLGLLPYTAVGNARAALSGAVWRERCPAEERQNAAAIFVAPHLQPAVHGSRHSSLPWLQRSAVAYVVCARRISIQRRGQRSYRDKCVGRPVRACSSIPHQILPPGRGYRTATGAAGAEILWAAGVHKYEDVACPTIFHRNRPKPGAGP